LHERPELAELVRHRRPDIKIVLTSGYFSEDSCQATFTVRKPWRVDHVAKRWRMSALEGTK